MSEMNTAPLLSLKPAPEAPAAEPVQSIQQAAPAAELDYNVFHALFEEHISHPFGIALSCEEPGFVLVWSYVIYHLKRIRYLIEREPSEIRYLRICEDRYAL